MTELFLRVIDRAEPWALTVLCAVVVAGVAAALGIGLWKYAQGVRREERYPAILEKYSVLLDRHSRLTNDLQWLRGRLQQLHAIMDSVSGIVGDYTTPPRTDVASPEVWETLIGRHIMEALRDNVKRRPGGVHQCGIWVKKGEWIELRFGAGFDLEIPMERRLPTGNSIGGSVLRTGKYRLCANVLDEGDYYFITPGQKPEYRSLICFPIEARREVVGVLTVDAREEGFFDRDDLRIASLYAHLVALHLGNSLKREGGTDGWQRPTRGRGSRGCTSGTDEHEGVSGFE